MDRAVVKKSVSKIDSARSSASASKSKVKKKSKKRVKERTSRRKHSKKKSRKRHSSSSSNSSTSSSSSSSSDSSSSDSSEEERERKRKKAKKRKAKKKKEKLKASQNKVIDQKTLPAPAEQLKPEDDVGPHIDLKSSKIRAPMTKEEYEKQQNTLTWVTDEGTGRRRLIRGSGEVLEVMVSKERHQAINKQATAADGNFFQNQSLAKARSMY